MKLKQMKFRGGKKMLIVNILLMAMILIFIAEISQWLIPMLIREFKEMEN